MSSHIRKFEAEIQNLRYEVSSLRSIVIGILGRDREGKYRPSFIREILQAGKEKPTHVFRGSGSLLTDIRNVK